MKIAYVITRSDAVGGASIHVRDLAAEMQARGHQVLVLVGGTGVVTDQLRAAAIPFHSLRWLRRSIQPVWDRRAYVEMRAALRDWAPSLVSCHTAKAGWLARAACRELGLPAVYTPHGWSIGNRIGRVPGLFFGVAERIAARWSGAIVCSCEHERRVALARHIGGPGSLHVIHHGVHDVPRELRADPGAHPPRIVCVARFERPKDHDTLIGAMARLRSEAWELDLIGDGLLMERIRNRVRREGLDGRVVFSGYLRNPAAALARAQLFVLSSRSEGFPRSVLEAMRAGLPVVASDVGGIGEALLHGASGRLVAPGSVLALAEAIKPLILSKAEREKLGAAARETYSSRFGFARMADTTERLYDAVRMESGAGRPTP